MARAILVVAFVVAVCGCGRSLHRISPPEFSGTPQLNELWEEPADITARDLFHGGRTTYPHILKWFRLRGFGQGTRNDLPGFEQQGFITRVEADRAEFAYRGIYRDVIESVTPADVAWTAALLARLSDRQWDDAFWAGGYDPDERRRYIVRIKSKIGQGLALAAN